VSDNHTVVLHRKYDQIAAITWSKLGKDFWSLPGTKVVAESGDGKSIGSIRFLPDVNLRETLLAYVDEEPQFLVSYKFTEPALGLDQYTATWVIASEELETSSCTMTITMKSATPVFRKTLINLLQNVFLPHADPPKA
jgi:hypothetical protein